MTDPVPSATRRERERATTRQRISDTALAILEDEGTAALTMRGVASAIGYTAPIVYQHFANKDDLVRELIADGYRRLVAEMTLVEADVDPERRLLEVATRYVRFAGEHPHLFEAMNGTAIAADVRRAAAHPATEVVRELLTTWSEARGVPLDDLDDACEIVWGTLSGMASIGRLETIGNARAQRLAVEALSAMLRGWRGAEPPVSAAEAPIPTTRDTRRR